MLIDPYRFGAAPGGGEIPVEGYGGGQWNAELGNMTGWTTTVGSPRVRPTDADPPGHAPQGSRFYDGGAASATSSCYQRIPLAGLVASGLSLAAVDAGTVDIKAVWWGGQYIQGPPADQPQLQIVFRDTDTNEISRHASGFKSPTTVVFGFRWDEYTELTDIPANTRYIDIVMDFDRNFGTENNACFDDIRVSLIQ